MGGRSTDSGGPSAIKRRLRKKYVKIYVVALALTGLIGWYAPPALAACASLAEAKLAVGVGMISHHGPDTGFEELLNMLFYLCERGSALTFTASEPVMIETFCNEALPFKRFTVHGVAIVQCSRDSDRAVEARVMAFDAANK